MILRALSSLQGILLVWLLVAVITLHQAVGFAQSHNKVRNNIYTQFEARRAALKKAHDILKSSALNLLTLSKKTHGSSADAEKIKAGINDLYASINQARNILQQESIVSKYKDYLRLKRNNRTLPKETKLFEYYDNTYHKFVEVEELFKNYFKDLNDFAQSISFKTGVHLSIESEKQSYQEFQRFQPGSNSSFFNDWNNLDTIKDQISELEGLAKTHNIFIQMHWGKISSQMIILDNMLSEKPIVYKDMFNLKTYMNKDKARASSINVLQQKLHNYKNKRKKR